MFFIERQILYLKQLSHCPCNFMNISSEEFFSLGGIIFCCSVTKSYPTLCNPAFQASLSFTISQSLLKLMFITSVMPSNHLILYCPLLLLPQFSQHQGLFQWVGSLHQMARVLELQHQSFQWIQGWFPLGLTVWSPCCSRYSQESSPVPQFESISSSVLSLLYGPTLTSIPDYWKNHSFNHTDLRNSMKKHYVAYQLISESEHVAHSLFSGPLVKLEVKTLEKGRKKPRISLE